MANFTGTYTDLNQISIARHKRYAFISLLILSTFLISTAMAAEKIFYSTILELADDPFNNTQRFSYKGLYGYDDYKLELFTNEAETSDGRVDNADLDILYWQRINELWSVKAGVNYFNRPAERPYWQPGIGLEGELPFIIEFNARAYYYSNSVKFDIECFREVKITDNIVIRGGLRSIFATKTVKAGEIGNGLNQMRYIIRPYYQIDSNVALFAEFEQEEDYGVFKKFLIEEDEVGNRTTLTLGLSVLF